MPSLRNHPAFTPSAPEGDLAVVACHFNPVGYRRPVDNLARFLDGMRSVSAPLFMTELTFDDCEPVLPVDSPRVLQVRTTRENVLWEKESLLSAAARRLPPQFTKVAWLDADVLLSRPDWLTAASALLDTSPLIQLFSRAILTDCYGKECRIKSSVGHAAALRDPDRTDWRTFHPGFAWASRRELFSPGLNGLYHCLVGSGDSLLALAGMGKLTPAAVQAYNPRVQREILDWGKNISAWTRRQLTSLPGDITHLWHGDARNRAYSTRFDSIAELDPETDLHTDPLTGLTTWTTAAQAGKPRMVSAVRDYFSTRQEDTAPAPL